MQLLLQVRRRSRWLRKPIIIISNKSLDATDAGFIRVSVMKDNCSNAGIVSVYLSQLSHRSRVHILAQVKSPVCNLTPIAFRQNIVKPMFNK